MRIRYLLIIAAGSIALLYLLSRRRRHLPSWLVIVPGLIVVGAMAAVVATQADDAYITYRYARNLAQGHGPVYNPGERVEGYTNPLWMLLLAGGYLLGVPPTTLAPVLAAILLVVMLLLLDRILIAEGISNTWLRGTLPVALGLSPAFVLWWFSGMEVPAYACLIVAICWLLSRDRLTDAAPLFIVGLLLGAIVLTRSDGILMVAIATIWLLYQLRKADRPNIARAMALLLGPVAVVLITQEAFRLLYYGEWLPNTYYAKLAGQPSIRLRMGLLYIVKQFQYLGGLSPLIASVIAAVWARHKQFARLGIVAVAGYLIFFCYTGGDGLDHRFFVHVTPLLYLMTWIGVVALWRKLPSQSKGQRSASYLIGAALVGALLLPVTYLPAIKGYRCFTSRLHLIGFTLAEVGREDFTLAVCAAGIIPYHTNMPTIDMLGLCDAHIARTPPKCALIGGQKWDGYYVVSSVPDVISRDGFFDKSDGLSNQPVEGLVNFPVVYNEIRNDPRFQENYSRVSVPQPDGRWFIFWGHRRRDWQRLIPEAVIVPVASEYQQIEGSSP